MSDLNSQSNSLYYKWTGSLSSLSTSPFFWKKHSLLPQFCCALGWLCLPDPEPWGWDKHFPLWGSRGAGSGHPAWGRSPCTTGMKKANTCRKEGRQRVLKVLGVPFSRNWVHPCGLRAPQGPPSSRSWWRHCPVNPSPRPQVSFRFLSWASSPNIHKQCFQKIVCQKTNFYYLKLLIE